MKLLRKFRKSIKIQCSKCGNPQMCRKNSRCHVSGLCSRCMSKLGYYPELVPKWYPLDLSWYYKK